MKFAHLADSHLGSWKQPEMQKLNLESFKKAIETAINEKVNFVLFAGDLFDNPFPPIDILKEAVKTFRQLKEAGIKSFVIAGSHDYSVSGKTFLEILEKAGLAEICKYTENEEEIVLTPCVYESIHIYGYPGKKSGMEMDSIKKIKIVNGETHYRILMLHTTLENAAENHFMESIKFEDLPEADYYALGHIHVDFEKEINGKPVVYGGPTFPNNFKELEELKYGRFYIVEMNGYTKIIKKQIKLKEPLVIRMKIENSLTATDEIIETLKNHNLKDKILLLKVEGTLMKGKISDIDFRRVEEFAREQGVYSFLKNTSKLETEKTEINLEIKNTDMEGLEEELIEQYKRENPSKFNDLIVKLIHSLSLEKQEDEKTTTFENRLMAELNKTLNLNLQ